MRKVQMVTDRELEILKILWAREKASVREVQDDLNKTAGPVAYSTVQTLLNIMEDKKGFGPPRGRRAHFHLHRQEVIGSDDS